MANLSVNNMNIYYELHGQGRPLVLIAGFSCDHTFWSSIVPELSKRYQVLVFDNRGVGQTQAENVSFTVETMADDTIALIRKLSLNKPIIVGQSMGSAISQTIGKKYPDEAKNLILMNTFSHLLKAPELAFTLTGELQQLMLPISCRVKSIAPWVFSSEFLSQPNQLKNIIDLAEDNPYQQTLDGYQGQLQALTKFDSRPWLSQIALPTLIIVGEEDIIAPDAGAKEVGMMIGKMARITTIPGGHASPIEQPAKVIQAIVDFSS